MIFIVTFTSHFCTLTKVNMKKALYFIEALSKTNILSHVTLKLDDKQKSYKTDKTSTILTFFTVSMVTAQNFGIFFQNFFY